MKLRWCYSDIGKTSKYIRISEPWKQNNICNVTGQCCFFLLLSSTYQIAVHGFARVPKFVCTRNSMLRPHWRIFNRIYGPYFGILLQWKMWTTKFRFVVHIFIEVKSQNMDRNMVAIPSMCTQHNPCLCSWQLSGKIFAVQAHLVM